MYINQKICLIYSQKGEVQVVLLYFLLSVVGSANVKNPFLSPGDDSAAFKLLLTTNR